VNKKQISTDPSTSHHKEIMMAIYMKLDGLNGNVTTQGYENWIECMDITFSGISSHIQQEIGNDMDRIMNHPKFGDITIIKALDRSSIALFEHAHSRKAFSQVEIHNVNTSDPIFTYAKLILKNAIVSHYSEFNSTTLHAKPYEHITFSYTAIEKTYIPKNPDNSSGSPLISGYDLSQGEAL
jgi:type VI secretion system secreted protein Hcp